MIDKFNAEYIAGGAAQNTARVAQVIPLQYRYHKFVPIHNLHDF